MKAKRKLLLVSVLMAAWLLGGCTQSADKSVGSAGAGAATEAETETEAVTETAGEVQAEPTDMEEVSEINASDIPIFGVTSLNNPMHKIVALVLEYPENVEAPSADSFKITDTEAQYYYLKNEVSDGAEAEITAVYTNSKPERRVDQKSVEGNYVIIEIRDSTDIEYNEDDGLWHTNIAGLANVRYDPEYSGFPNSSVRRKDWSNFVVEQTADVMNAEGQVVCTAGILPTLSFDELVDPAVDRFVDLDMQSSYGNPIYGSLYVPEDYDESKSYPLVIDVSGGSQRLIFDEDGNPINIGTTLTRDTGAVGWLRVTDDVIIAAIQPQKEPPYKQYDEYQDTYDVIQNLIETYNIDEERIYGIGSSYGTLHLSTVISQHPGLFTAYIQCNGNFVGAQNMYKDEADVTGADYTDESLIKDDSEYYEEFRTALQGVVDNGTRIVVCHGRNDETAPITRGVTTYRMLKRMYEEAGKSTEEIDELVKLNVYEDEDYYKVGLFKFHDAIRLASRDTELLTWVMEQTKSGKEVVLTKNLPLAEEMEIDLDDYFGQVIEGYYNFDCMVSEDVTRSAKFYIPANTVYNQPTVFIGVPGNTDTWEFFVESGWKALADEKIFHVVLMEPENGTWGDEEAEIAYIKELNEDVSYRPFFCAFSSNFYGVAYADAADILLKHSQGSPKSWAGIAVLGASGMSAEEAEELATAESKVPGVSLAEVQTPVWITVPEENDDTARLLDFYRSANHSQEEASVESYARAVYLPMEGGTVDDEWCAKVIYDEADWKDCVNESYSEKIYTELFEGVYRYPGDANGALRRPGEIFSRGFEAFQGQVAGGYNEDGSDVYTRDWYVYVPESVNEAEPAPLVFVFHGAGGSGNEIADRSGWAKVAEDNGFIIICPTASHQLSVRRVSNIVTSELFRAAWNTGDAEEMRPSDLKFVEYLYDWAKENYNIDTTRVYASGQSSGGMMSWACADKLPGIFAAVAPVSATRASISDNDTQIPIITFIGEEDTTFKGGFSGDDGKAAIDYWTGRNNTVENYESYTYMDGGQNCTQVDGLFTEYLFSNAGGVPMLRCFEVATKTHAIWPSECYKAWEEWFVSFSRDPDDGTLYYNGEAVD